MRIKITKVKQVNDYGHFPYHGITEGKSIIGDTINNIEGIAKTPTVGKPFFLKNYKTSFVEEILSPDSFRTHNAIYKWEKLD